MTITVAAAPPLAQSVTQVNSREPRLRLYLGLPADVDSRQWLHCADLLAEPHRFDNWRAGLADWLLAEYGTAPERTTAGYLMSWYLHVPGYLAGVMFHSERRVPSLRPEDLAFRLGPDRPHPDAVTLLSTGFACLPGDPAANSPEATVVADERALAAILRARFVGHAARFVAAFGPRTRFGRRTLWAAATDAIDRSIWQAGRLFDNEDAGVADAALLLPEKLAPFTSGTTLRQDDDAWTRRRESCCFHYALPGTKTCATCPRNVGGTTCP